MSNSDLFRGNNEALIRSIQALLALDAKGALAPHGIGEMARDLLEACAARLPAQHQGEPVVLPERTTDTQSCSDLCKRIGLYGAVSVWRAGEVWNACLDEIAKLGPLYTRPAPAEQAEVIGRLKELVGEESTDERANLRGEVERLRSELKLRDRELEIAAEAHGEIQEDLDNLRAQLAERDALLTRALPYLSNTPDLVQHGAEDLAEEIRSASAGRPCYGPNEWGTECGKCSKCKHASAEPSAPVERDERADFEALHDKTWPRSEFLHLSHHEYGKKLRWEGWQARAALERKPSFEAAYNEWVDKSEWARKGASAKELGLHLADVIRMRYERLQSDLTARDERLDALEQTLRSSPCAGAGAQILAFMESRGEQ